jgi:integral membrane protein
MTQAPSVLGLAQPPVTRAQLAEAKGGLLRYRIMAFVTGVVLLAGCVSLIFKYGTNVDVEPWTGYLWVAHGWLFVIYVVATAYVGIKLRWPLARYGLVMLAGTIPTMSFVAEHFVTRDAAQAPADVSR